jgi:hypothetical protein
MLKSTTATIAAAASAALVAASAGASPPASSNAGCVGASVSQQAQSGGQAFGQQTSANARNEQPFGAVVSAFAHRDRPAC